MDDGELRKAVDKARQDLKRALEDRSQGEAEIETTYRRESEDARGWFVTGFHGERRFADREVAWEAARRSVPWLDDP